MKIRKINLFLLFFILKIYIYGQSDPKFWENLYNKSETLKEKYQMTRDIYNSAETGFENLILRILTDQAMYSIDTSTAEEKRIYDEWVYYSVSTVDRLNAKIGLEEMKKIYYKITSPRHKGNILYTMGKIKDEAYLPWLNDQLRILNTRHKKSDYREEDNDQLYGALRGLEFYNDPSSFDVIFYAAIPNYKDKIRKLAGEILKKITNDPAPLCSNIIKKETSQKMKLEALNYAINSESPIQSKIETCKIALQDSFFVPGQKDENDIQLRIRNTCVNYLGEFKANSPDIIELIEKKWGFDSDTASNLITIEALKKIGTEDAVRTLGKKLMEYIDKKKEGAKTGFTEDEGLKIMVAIIRAIGDTPGNAGLDKVYLIKYGAEFENILKIEAQKAINKKLGK